MSQTESVTKFTTFILKTIRTLSTQKHYEKDDILRTINENVSETNIPLPKSKRAYFGEWRKEEPFVKKNVSKEVSILHH